MAKLSMCRICLVDNVRLLVVADKNLQEIYEKLSDVPFVTEDRRPMLACFFCYAKLKQSYQLQKKCQAAEELFAQMMLNFELKSLTNRGHSEFVGGFVKTVIENINIVDDGNTDSGPIEIELPAVSKELCNIVEVKVERESDELEPGNRDDTHLDVVDIPPHHSESDSEDEDDPLTELKTEVVDMKEEAVPPEVSKKIHKAKNTKQLEPGNRDDTHLDVVDIPPHHSKSDSEDEDDPLTELKTEVVDMKEEAVPPEVSKKIQKAKNTKRLPAVKKSKPIDAASKAKIKKTGPSNSKTTRPVQIRTSKPVTQKFRVPNIPKPKVQKNVISKSNDNFTEVKTNLIDYIHSAIDTSFFNKSNLKSKIFNNITFDNAELSKLPKLSGKEKRYKCEICQLCFSDRGSLRTHFLEHGEKPFKCHFCQRGFDVKCHMDKHVRIHTGEKPYKCDECQRCFSEKSNLTKHIRRHAGDKPYKCDICQRSFNQKCQLVSHSLLHTGETPYKCEICQQGFNRLYNFKQHYRTHTGEKPHSCIICQRSFTHKTSLVNHLRRHTGEKPFKCFVCQRSFTHKQSLDMHFRKHTGEKPYKCEQCQRCFTQSSHLKAHMRTHTGEKTTGCTPGVPAEVKT